MIVNRNAPYAQRKRARRLTKPTALPRPRKVSNAICLRCMSRIRGHVMQIPEIIPFHQVKCLRLLGGGLTNKEIAFRLGLSTGTVKQYLYSTYKLLGLTSRFEAALWAREHQALLTAPLAA